MPRHLRPTAPIAADALLPGDPKRAMELATALLEKPLMSNLSRGLWGYHGRTAGGLELTVQSTGIGGPSAAVVVAELAELGVRRAIRIGTCVALDPELELGATLIVAGALARDGTGAALTDADPVRPDPELTGELAARVAPDRAGIVASTDLYYDPDPSRRASWRAAGAVAVDLAAAAILAAGRRAGVATACALRGRRVGGGRASERRAPRRGVARPGGIGAEAFGAGRQAPASPEGAPLS